MKIGFICEGKTEKKILESQAFKNILTSLNLDIVEPVIDAEGKDKLLPRALNAFTEELKNQGAEAIVILTDRDKDVCITFTKQRITNDPSYVIIVAVKTIEAWFLADSDCMSTVLKKTYGIENPEDVEAFAEIKKALVEYTGRGANDKILLSGMMIRNGFSVANAAKHPNCHSAKYFISKLTELGKAAKQ